MWRCVDVGLTDVSEERIVSIFKVEKSPLSLFLYSWLFRLVAQSAATYSRWFNALGFFYPEDGGDTFLLNVG
jgi:hypothetical protein